MSYVTETHPHAPHHGARSIFVSIFHAISEFFSLIGTATMAAREFEMLNRMSDHELSRKGLARIDIPKHIFTRHFS